MTVFLIGQALSALLECHALASRPTVSKYLLNFTTENNNHIMYAFLQILLENNNHIM